MDMLGCSRQTPASCPPSDGDACPCLPHIWGNKRGILRGPSILAQSASPPARPSALPVDKCGWRPLCWASMGHLSGRFMDTHWPGTNAPLTHVYLRGRRSPPVFLWKARPGVGPRSPTESAWRPRCGQGLLFPPRLPGPSRAEPTREETEIDHGRSKQCEALVPEIIPFPETSNS